MKINANVRYAIRMMIDIMEHSKRNEPVHIKDVSQRQRISRRFLGQLVIPLKNASLLKSISGRHGGYILARRPDEIKIGEIFEALNGPIILLDCIEGEEFCISSAYCKCRKMWEEVNGKIKGTLYSFSLEDLSEEGKKTTFPEQVAHIMEGYTNPCRSYSECLESIKTTE
ncbi:MAG: Rrf2 family transcriptional regulator [bacterium]